MKQIQLTEKEFKQLVMQLEQCRKDKDKLQKALDYLNEEIKKYNKQFN